MARRLDGLMTEWQGKDDWIDSWIDGWLDRWMQMSLGKQCRV